MCDAAAIGARLPTSSRAIDVLLGGWSAAGRSRIMQAAVAGRWEESSSIGVPASAAAAQMLVRDRGPADADVAVEHEWLGYPLVFVGARRAQDLPGEPAGFEAAVVRLAERDAVGPAEALAALAGGPPTELDSIELGAANAWQSVGPLQLWTRGEDPTIAGLAARLRDHPALARCVAPVALEIAFGEPRACWIGIEVSDPSTVPHVVDPSAVEAIFTRLFAAAR